MATIRFDTDGTVDTTHTPTAITVTTSNPHFLVYNGNQQTVTAEFTASGTTFNTPINVGDNDENPAIPNIISGIGGTTLRIVIPSDTGYLLTTAGGSSATVTGSNTGTRARHETVSGSGSRIWYNPATA